MVIQPPEYQERLLIVGENGTGKSELSFMLDRFGNYRKVIYVDHKGDCVPRGEFRLVTKPDDRWGWSRGRRIVYRPAHGSYWHSDRGFELVLERLFHQAVRAYDHKRRRSREPFVVIIQEILLFGPRSQKVIGEMASAGRNYELGLWIETQRPRRLPVVCRSEAWRIYAFPLGYQDDEEEVIKYAKGRLSIDAFRELEDSISKQDPHPFYELIRRTKEGAQISVRRCGSLELPAA
jgi:hypothetical protein